MKQTHGRGMLDLFRSARMRRQSGHKPDIARVMPAATAWAIFYAIAIVGALISERPSAVTAVAAVNGAKPTVDNR